MPSSLIFTGLVVVWLLILVPAVARHQQEVAHLSDASLAGRVLTRPRRGRERRLEGHPSEEDSMDDDGSVGTRTKEVWVPTARKAAQQADAAVSVPVQSRWDDDEPGPETEAEAAAEAEPAAEADLPPDPEGDDEGWERPPPRYRRGRGGFDPDADAAAARRRYAFRQRVVLALLVGALLTAVAAVVVGKVIWWAHAGVDLVLVSYLIYLRRQVREEADIRDRRAARMAGTRRPSAADDHELDEWARRGREVTRRPAADPAEAPEPATTSPAAEDPAEPADRIVDEMGDELVEDGDSARVRGVGEPIGLLPARRRGADGTGEPESALPPLQPAPPPPLPPGTSLVVVDDDDLDLHDLGAPGHPHRPAAAR